MYDDAFPVDYETQGVHSLRAFSQQKHGSHALALERDTSCARHRPSKRLITACVTRLRARDVQAEVTGVI